MLLWLSFLTILQLGLEVGIGVGIVMAVCYFSYAYAKASGGTASLCCREGRGWVAPVPGGLGAWQ